MGLQEQHAVVRFAGGIETKTDSKLVPTTRLLALENGVFTKGISIKKRNGYIARSRAIDGSASQVSGLEHLAVRDDELLAFTENRCYSNQSDADQWADVGAMFSVGGTERAVVRTGTQQINGDHATHSGVSVFAWEDSRGGVWWTVRDATSGRVHRAPTQADANGQRPRCLPVGDALHIYYAVPTTTSLMVLIVNPGQPSAAVTPIVLLSDLDATNPNYDACVTDHTGSSGLNHPAAIVWHENATNNYRMGYVDQGGFIGSPASGYPSAVRGAVAIAATSPLAIANYSQSAGGGGVDDDQLAVIYIQNAVADAAIDVYNGGDAAIPMTLVAQTSWYTPTNVQRMTCAFQNDSTNTIWMVAEEAAAQPTQKFCKVNSIADLIGAGITGTVRTLRSVGLASRAFQAGSAADVFAFFIHDATYFNVYLGFRLSDFAPVARQVPGGASAPTRAHLPSVHVVSNVGSACVAQKERVESANNDKFGETGLHLLTLDFGAVDHSNAQLGTGLYVAGACPMHYDGRQWSEQGFHVGPELITTLAAGGGSMTDGTYKYVSWYEWTDAQGEVHRGPTSFGTTVTLSGTTQVTLTLPTLRVTQKPNVRICVARSKNGDSAQLFRVTSLDPTTSGAAANGYVANDTTVDSVSFVDRFSDATLATQEPLYTNGGILSNDPIELGSVIAVGNNRLFATDASDPLIVRYSKELVQGFGVEFAPELFQPVDPFGGDITAVAVLDDKVVVFKATSIFAFNGDGPLASGDTSLGGFSAAQLITSDVGCEVAKSIAVTPDGLVFKSAKGIYRLGRDLQVQYVGAPVEAYNSQTVVRATTMPDRSQIVFLTDSGKTLLFDFLFGQWSTFTNHAGLDACVVGGTYHYLRTDGERVYRETIGSYSDDGTRITLLVETAWIHLWEHLQGLQRFWKLLALGTWGSPHQLGIQYQTDFEEGWTDPVWLDATGESSSTGWITGGAANAIGVQPIIGTMYGEGVYGAGVYGGTNPSAYEWRLGLHVDGKSIRFRFQDFERVGLTGATFELTELLITGGVIAPDERPFTAGRSA